MTNTFVLPSWPGSLCACERESVGVVQEARDHSYFRTPSVVSIPMQKTTEVVAGSLGGGGSLQKVERPD